MNKKKVFFICCFTLILLLTIFFSKDFIFRRVFISKLENVNFEEYIVTFISNNQKKETYYCKSKDKYISRGYDENNELYNFEYVTDVKNKKSYTYDFDTEKIDNEKEIEKAEPVFSWNEDVLKMLKNEDSKQSFSFKYLGIENIDNIKCYKMIFEDGTGWSCTAYVNKETLNTMKLDFDLEKILTEKELEESENLKQTVNHGHVIWEYDWDFELNQEELFKI